MDMLSSDITTLPTEIVEHVIEHLQLSDLCEFRLTCKALAEKSFYYLGHTYCAQASTNLSLASIEKLDQRSWSSCATFVKDFRLVWDKDTGQGLHWDREDNSKALPISLPVIQQMRDILLRFTNCCALYIEKGGHHNTIDEPTTFYHIKNSDIVAIGFSLIAETALPLKKFGLHHLDGVNYDGTPAELTEEMLRLEQTKRAAFKTAFSGLQRLTLWSYRVVYPNYPNMSNTTPYHSWKWDLVALSPNLEKLDLVMGLDHFNYLHPVSLPHLQKLVLKRLLISSENLLEILLGVGGTLRSLTLELVWVDQGFRDILPRVQNFEKLEKIVVTSLKASGPHSRICTFHGLDETSDVPGSGGRKLKLRNKIGPNSQRGRGAYGVKYSGPGVQGVVATLARVIDETGAH